MSVFNQKFAGFTLLEVLVALFIISIALTALMKTSCDTVRHILYLYDKTIAVLIADTVINESKLGFNLVPYFPQYKQEDRSEMGETWVIQAWQQHTQNLKINQLHVKVFRKQGQKYLVQLQSSLHAS